MAGLGRNILTGVKLSIFDDWQPGALAGMSGPQAAQVTPSAPSGNGNVAASDGSYYNQAQLQALEAQIQPGADGRKVLGNDAWMQLLNPLSGLKVSQAADPGHLIRDASGDMVMGPSTQAVYKDAQGRTYKDVGNGQVQYFDNSGGGWNNPTGSGNDTLQPTYKLNADGSATPVSSGAQYTPSEWVSSGRLATELAATVGTAGAAGAYFGGAGALGSAAADAAAPTAAAATTEAGTGALATSAPAYGGVGTAGAGAAGEGAAPWTLSTALGDSGGIMGSGVSAGQVLSGLKAVSPILGGLASHGNSGSSSSGSGAAPLGTASPTDMGRASSYTYGGMDPNSGIAPLSRPNHTMGPSSAVNLNDPSSAMFGYGAKPIYFSQAPNVTTIPVTGHQMADGGSVDDNSDPFSNPQFDFSQNSAPQQQSAPFDPNNGNDYGMMSSGAADPSDAHLKSAVAGGINMTQDPNGGPAYNPQGTGPLGWLKRLAAGDKDTKGQAAIGVGALGLIAQLLHHNAVAPGYQTAAQLHAGLIGNGGMTPQQLASMSSYFNTPAARFQPTQPQPGVVTTPRYAGGGQVDSTMPQTQVYDPRVHGPYVAGSTGGQADKVQANLAHGEYVFDADTVASLGDGNNAHGAQKLDEMREAIRVHKRSAPSNEIPPAALSPLAYMRSR